jgi:flagellar biosynthesis/type III secretory pathway protein FliH
VDERFVSLAALVRANAAAPVPEALADLPCAVSGIVDFAHAHVVADLALMRLAALEACESGMGRVIRLCAAEVLARELMLAPADIDAIVKRALASFALHEPVEIVVSAADAERVRAPLPVRVDPKLVAGDLVVLVRDGELESTFGFRLEDALARAARRT